MKKYVENMKKYLGNTKKYEEIQGRYGEIQASLEENFNPPCELQNVKKT